MDEDRCEEGAEHREPAAPSVDGLIARLEAATEGTRELSDDVLLACGWQLNWGAEEIEEVRRGGWKLEGEDGEGVVESFATFADNACWYRPGHKPFRDQWIDGHYRPSPSVSVDAALALIPDCLVDACLEIQSFPEYCNASICSGEVEPFNRKSIECTGRTPPLAVCILALRVRSIVPPTGRVELGERSNTEPQPTTTAATQWQATLEAEKASILDFVVDGKIGDDPSPSALMDYTDPTLEAESAADELFEAAKVRAQIGAFGDDLGASIDRLGVRLTHIREHLPALLDRFAEQNQRDRSRPSQESESAAGRGAGSASCPRPDQ